MAFKAYRATPGYLFPAIPALMLLMGCQKPAPSENVTPSGTAGNQQAESMKMAARRHAQPVTVNYPETGVDVGWGWDSEEGIPQPNVCIEYSIEEDKGQTKYMTMTEVTDTREVMQSMNVSAAASVKSIAYKASGGAKFAKNSKINSSNSNFVLNVSVDNGVRYATPLKAGSRGEIIDPQTRKSQPDAGAIRLTPKALGLAQQRDLTHFLNFCGDAYVAALYGGARLTAVITVTNSNKEEKKSASSHFSGSGWGANVKASASGATDAKITKDRVSMRFHQSGGRDDAIPASKEELVDRLGDITRLASDYPAYYRVTLMPYTALSNWPDKEIELDLSELDQLAGLWAQYDAIYEDLEKILESPLSDYKKLDSSNNYVAMEDKDIKRLRALQDQVQLVLRQLRDEAIRCSEPEEPCEFNEDSYLSPYAYRIQMPLPSNMLDSKPNGASDLVDFYVRSPVKSRCRNNPVSSDCLSNAQIDGWESRVNKTAVELPDRQTAEKLMAKITADKAGHSWLDVIDAPPYAWIDPAEIIDGETGLSTLLALLETGPEAKMQ
jgi:hypothetical protein